MNIRSYIRDNKTPIRKFLGLVFTAVAVLSLTACLSYIFTWKQDQSLLTDDAALQAANIAGRIGMRLSAALVGRWFGLGAFAIVFALFVLSLRLVFGKRDFSVLRVVVLSLSCALLVSYILSYGAMALGMENVFGGGLGGECGMVTVLWVEKMVGKIVTFLLLAILSVLWLYFASRKFSVWFSSEAKGIVGASNKEGAAGNDAKGKSGFNFHENSAAVNEEGEKDVPVQESVPQKEVTLAQSVGQEVTSASTTPVDNVVSSSVKPSGVSTSDSDVKIVEGKELSTDVVAELPRIDVREELQDYRFPTLDLLGDYTNAIHNVSDSEIKKNNYRIRATLMTYKIGIEDIVAVVGPTVTLYKVYPSKGVKISAIQALHKEIAMALSTEAVRIDTLADSVGIEVPNDSPSIVPLKALLNDEAFRNSKADLPVAIGYTITQKVEIIDLADAPHLLIAGATKQGKSVGLNVLITSLLYKKHPSELKFVFIDPKMVEFTAYKRLLHHYLAVLPTAASEDDELENAIVKKPAEAEAVLKSLCIEMDERFELLAKAGVNNLNLYNDKYRNRRLLPTDGHRFLPYIVAVIDEYADLTMSTGTGGEGKNTVRSITNSVIRLAQKGRAAGIHIVLATQRPTVDIITGVIKANFPSRIAFRVFSQTDSKTILDSPGAEKLIGKGDMLYYSGIVRERVQCAFISNDEINAITKFIGDQIGYKKSFNTPYYLPSPEENKTEEGTGALDASELDSRFEEAARMVVTTQRGSTSDIQRRLGMGYAKAGRVMDQLESAGIVGPQEGSKPRQVLISDLDELDALLRSLKSE